MVKLDINLFGTMEIRCNGATALPKAIKDRAVLARLASTPGAEQSRSYLAGLLWGAAGERRARESLKQSLLRLRRQFATLSPHALNVNRQSVSLRADAVCVDVIQFHSALGQGTTDALKAALDLHKGHFLQNVDVDTSEFEQWRRQECTKLQHAYKTAALRLLQTELAEQNLDGAAKAASLLLTREPTNEKACRTLMRLYAQRGERAEALRLLRALQERVLAELEMPLEASTLALGEHIREGRLPGPAQELSNDAPAVSVHAAPNHETGQKALPLATEVSLAVLPFTRIRSEQLSDDFAIGLSEDIITDLTCAGITNVLPPEACTHLDERAATNILKGSVRESQGRVRVTAQLVDAKNGRQIWARRFDRSTGDTLTLQDELARDITAAIKPLLSKDTKPTASVVGTDSASAHDLFLRGRYYYLRGLATHNLRVASALLRRATELDPGFARAHALLAICESHQSMSLGSHNARPPSSDCFQHCARAADLEPDLADAHAATGLALYGAGRYQDAEQKFDEAIRLDPNLFEGQFFQARNYRLQGDHSSAAAAFQRAARLRPNDFRALGLLSEELQALGEEDLAHVHLRQCLTNIEAELDTHPDNAGARGFGSAILADLGQFKRAKDWANLATHMAPDDCLVHYNVARAMAIMGKSQDALKALTTAFRIPPVVKRRLAMWMRSDEDFESLRAETGFQCLIKSALGDTAANARH